MIIPAFERCASKVVLPEHYTPLLVISPKKSQDPVTAPEETLDWTNGQPLISQLGGPVIYAFKVTRFFGCIGFLGLALITPSKEIIATAVYVSVLGLLSVTTTYKYASLASQHLATVLLVVFSVSAYRDLFPLLTFNEQPEDVHEGWLLWAKLAVLTTITLLPAVVPRQYIPVDPKNPSEFPHPEQTASWLSMSLYLWLDPIIFMAQHHDLSRNLKKRSFPHMDLFMNGKKRHLFFGLMRVFTPIDLKTTFMDIDTLRTGGEGAVIRPWVWITWIFVRSIYRLRYLSNGSTFSPTVEHGCRGELGWQCRRSAVEFYEYTRFVLRSEWEAKIQGQGRRCLKTQAKKPKSSADNLVGKINNLVTTDLGNIIDGRDFLLICKVLVCQSDVVSGSYTVSWVGGCFPLPGIIASRIQTAQMKKMEKTDARVQTVTETMNVLRMVKLFGWEKKMGERISEKREVELLLTWKLKLLELVNNNINVWVPLDLFSNIIPVLTMMATYSTYTLIMGKDLTASRVFSSMTVFDLMRDQLHTIFWTIPYVIQGETPFLLWKAGFNTLCCTLAKRFLEGQPNFLTSSRPPGEGRPTVSSSLKIMLVEESDLIGFRDAVFAWSNEANAEMLTSSKRRFNLRVDNEVLFKRGCINLIIGPTGAGKTSMLMALLGEMHFMPSGSTSWFNLPRKGGVAYAAQESWVQNETIRENILFGTAFDEARYKKVIYQCGLERDLELFEAGDRTEVGEKGLTLSGGQKARVTLARAVYSYADILLLDDVLAALDVHTAKWIVDKCFAGDLIKDRTVILVTHNVAMASAVAQYVVSLSSGGRIVNQGTISQAIATDKTLAAEIAKEQEILKRDEETVDNAESATEARDNNADGKLVMAEEILEGHVSWQAFKLYLTSLGGRHPIVFWFAFLFFMVMSEIATIAQTWFLGYWSSQYNPREPTEVDAKFYLAIYAVLLFLPTILYSPGYVLWFYGSLKALRSIHQRLVDAILGTTLRWLDATPTSRVITRCTQDIRAIDGPFAQEISWVIELTIVLVFRLLAVVALTPSFFFPGVLVGVVGGWVGRIYMKAQLSIKREMSNAKAPVLGHFSAAIAGLTSVRAYGAQTMVQEESLNRIDRYSRWVCVRIDLIGALFATALATYLVYGSRMDPANIGFSLNMADVVQRVNLAIVAFSSMILSWVRTLNHAEVNGNSIERINSYINIEQEPKATEGGQPPAYWPASGDLVVENLSARYSLDGPEVLHGLDFKIQSGERVGIVGRTGSGKSSLTLSLLRCIPTEGTVYFDGIPTSALNLDALRSNVTIIPQIPELLSGTLRQNLDPFDQYDDATLNDALRSAGLSSVQDETDEDKLTLDSAIATGGSNLSVGQRQILALARATVRGSKIIILDEATSAIDYKTDSAIQSSLRHEMQNVTQLIVAHRLQTIIDADKIMVLDAGRIVEFGSPEELLQNQQGMLKALVDESGDKDILYEMAGGKKSVDGE
ncbi:hypothetical protein BU15DRAFT_59613 [Melanogaster broomeanus]|nr:hypothetical protein BU15DRAFT_59613 [Melanogaster broomeanus]